MRRNEGERGQVVILMLIAMGLFIFGAIGLAIDGAQLFMNYTRLKRAVDAAAVAAANDFKRGTTLDRMENAALEILNMHQIDTSTVEIRVYMCDNDGDGVPNGTDLCPSENSSGFGPTRGICQFTGTETEGRLTIRVICSRTRDGIFGSPS